MRFLLPGILVTTVVGAIGFGAYSLGSAPAASAVQQPVATTIVVATASAAPTTLAQQPGQPVVVEARVAPVRSAKLTLPVAGIAIFEVLVREGDSVAQGAPLVRLDTRSLQLSIDTAKVELAQAKADYDKLLEGATPAQIAEAKAQIAQAQGQLTQVQGQVTSKDIAAAQARLAEARAKLADLQTGATAPEIDQARAAIDEAQAQREQERTALSATKEQAQHFVDERANDVRKAQVDYSNAYWDLQKEGDKGPRGEQLVKAFEVAKLALANAESTLERAKVDYGAARQDEIAGLGAANATVNQAQAKLNDLLDAAKPGELASARATVAAAEAELAQLSGGARAGDIAAASANISQAQARLAGLTADPSVATLAQVQAMVQQREVALKQAELAFERATLAAPMAGTIASISVAPGEISDARTPAMVLADVSTWQLETQDLDDLSVVRIQEGAPVKISFYAIPGLELTGKVERVKPLGTSTQDKALYTAIIKPDHWDNRLRWNMVAQVTIMPVR